MLTSESARVTRSLWKPLVVGVWAEGHWTLCAHQDTTVNKWLSQRRGAPVILPVCYARPDDPRMLGSVSWCQFRDSAWEGATNSRLQCPWATRPSTLSRSAASVASWVQSVNWSPVAQFSTPWSSGGVACESKATIGLRARWNTQLGSHKGQCALPFLQGSWEPVLGARCSISGSFTSTPPSLCNLIALGEKRKQ